MGSHRLRSVLGTSDLSDQSEIGLLFAAQIARAAGADLHCFHCAETPAFHLDGLADASAREQRLRGARADLQEQIGRVLGDMTRVATVEVGVGKPSREINARAESVGADVIVLGPHEQRAAFDDLLGTTADRVIRTSSVPCLIAARRPRGVFRHVLVPTDFSKPATRALAVGIDWLDSIGALNAEDAPLRIDVLYVSAFAIDRGRRVDPNPLLEKQAALARERLPPGALVELAPRILSAPFPIDGIRDTATGEDVDLIIMGTHGQGNLERALLGSMASRVVRTVPVPVLLVPPPPGKQGELVGDTF